MSVSFFRRLSAACADQRPRPQTEGGGAPGSWAAGGATRSCRALARQRRSRVRTVMGQRAATAIAAAPIHDWWPTRITTTTASSTTIVSRSTIASRTRAADGSGRVTPQSLRDDPQSRLCQGVPMARRPADGPRMSSVVGRSYLKRVQAPPPVRVESLTPEQRDGRARHRAEETARLAKAAADREAQRAVDERDRRELATRGLRRPGNGTPSSRRCGRPSAGCALGICRTSRGMTSPVGGRSATAWSCAVRSVARAVLFDRSRVTHP